MGDSNWEMEMKKLLDFENILLEKEILISRRPLERHKQDMAAVTELDVNDLKILKLRRKHRANDMELRELKRDLAIINVQLLKERKSFNAKGILEQFERNAFGGGSWLSRSKNWTNYANTNMKNLPKNLKLGTPTEVANTAVELIEKIDQLQSFCICEQIRIKDVHLTDAELRLLDALCNRRREQHANDMKALDVAITNVELKEIKAFTAKQILKLFEKERSAAWRGTYKIWKSYARSKKGQRFLNEYNFSDPHEVASTAFDLFHKVNKQFSCICEHIRIKHAHLTDVELNLMDAVCQIFPLTPGTLWSI